MPSSTKIFRITISFAVSLFFLYLTFFKPQLGAMFSGEEGIGSALFAHSRFDVAELGRAMMGAHWEYILMAGVLFFASLFVRAIRWKMMVNPLVKISYSEVFGAMNIGYMANNLLPLRMGELYRAQVIYQLTGLSRSAAFGSIVLERITDLLFLIPFIGLAIAIYPLPPSLQKAAYISAAGAFCVTVFFVWLVLNRSRALKLTAQFARILPHKLGQKFVALVDTFTAGLGALGRTDLYVWLAILSVLLWTMYTVMTYLMMASMGLTTAEFPMIANDRIGAGLVIMIITTLGFVIPGAPGAVGTYHGLAVLGLSLFAVPGDRAAGFAILLHALNYIPLTLMGLIFFWRFGLSFKGSTKLSEEGDPNRDLTVDSNSHRQKQEQEV
jgi:glycosyltransferase 2 family protein